jgi:Icc-related predicted phosphoesterase
MKIQYISDIHLELEENAKYLEANPLIVSGEILIMAGDIFPLNKDFAKLDFFNFISENYKEIFWLTGNHEFYNNDIFSFGNTINKRIFKNINIVNNAAVSIGGVRFIFTTLWSKISSENEWKIEQHIPDFDYISYSKRRFRSEYYNKLHNDSLEFLKDELKYNSKKKVVVTHHLPSDKCNSDKYRKSELNEAFCTDLDYLIEKSDFNFWIYGHSHFNQIPILVGNTILLTNQLGYVALKEHFDFKRNAYFSI